MNDGHVRWGSLPPLTPKCVAVGHLLPLLDADELIESESAEVREHVATCARCQSRIAGFAIVEDSLRRHYAVVAGSINVITLTDVISTAAIEEPPRQIETPAESANHARRRPSMSSAFGALAAALVITLLAALILSQMATRIGNQHPRPSATSTPLSGGKTPLSITTFIYSSTSSVLNGIVAGPDGNLWVANEGNPPYPSSILRITPNGAMTEYRLASGHMGVKGVKYIAVGNDGNLWFTENNAIGRVTPHGVITEFPLPGSLAYPNGIASGPDGNLWFTVRDSSGGGVIGRITPHGAITTFPIPTPNTTPQGISGGSDGAVWFVEVTPNQDGRIGRISPQGKITEFAIPTPGSAPTSIITGPDGNLWFTEAGSNKIARMTPGGVFTEFPLPTSNSGPTAIVMGPDHNLWFAEPGSASYSLAQIGRISVNGVITEFASPTLSHHGIVEITVDSRGRLWFTINANVATVVRVDITP